MEEGLDTEAATGARVGQAEQEARAGLGPAIEKARSPLNFNLDLGTINTLFSEDLSGLEDVFGFKRSLRYSGAVPLKLNW